MIRFADRSAYFNKKAATFWFELPVNASYDEIKFIQWVFEIDGIVYTHCIAGFEEAFHKAKTWQLLQELQ